MRLGDQSAIEVEAISTGALPLDLALGVGGVPRGRIVEIFGPESSGKTTLVYHIIAEAQARGGVCAFVDTEHAIDPIYARRIGVNTDELLISQPDYGEQALEIVDVLVRSGAVDVVAVDSVAALTPRVELEGQMGETQVGLQARLMSQALRKLAGNLSRANTICLFTNQIREKIGVMFGSPGDPAGRPGAEVLLLAAPRHPPHRDPQGGHRGGRQPGAREGRQEQGRGAVPPGRVRHRVRRRASRTRAACSTWRWSTTWSRSPARSSPTASCGSARGATTPSSSWPRTPRPHARSRRSCSRSLDIERPAGGRRSRPPIADRGRGSKPERARAKGRIAGRRSLREWAVTDRPADAFDVAVGALRRKERTRRRARRLASPSGYGDREVDAAIARLVEAGELDDERFARSYAEDKRALRGWGSERIREGLACPRHRRAPDRGGARGGLQRSTRWRGPPRSSPLATGRWRTSLIALGHWVS